MNDQNIHNGENMQERKIKVLDEHLINLIAAGEVIERASSVVKELVENAIDAGATQIEISLEEAGLKEIVVADNGCGMNEYDLKLAILPHATSKIKNDRDQRSDISFACDAYRAKVVDYNADEMCIEVTGDPLKIDAFIELMKPYGIIEMCRTGIVALDRGTLPLLEKNI